MIIEIIDRFQEIKPKLLEKFSIEEPKSYEDIFKQTIKMMFPEYDDLEYPDFERITVIDDGDYQGTLVFVVASRDYQLEIIGLVQLIMVVALGVILIKLIVLMAMIQKNQLQKWLQWLCI